MGLALFLMAAFLGGFASGLAGFAMGFVVSGIWLHVLTPVQTTTLIVGYGLWTQGYAVWKLRHALNWRNAAPFIIGGTIGVPIGTTLLTYVEAAYLRGAVGVLLVAYGTYGLLQPKFKTMQAGTTVDVGVGALNGMLTGLAGIGGLVMPIWSQLRGVSKDAQRTMFQPVIFAMIVMSAIALSVSGAITAETMKLYVLGLPAMLGGLWIGFRLYGKLDDAAFRKVVLWFMLAAGLALVTPELRSVADHRARHPSRQDQERTC